MALAADQLATPTPGYGCSYRDLVNDNGHSVWWPSGIAWLVSITSNGRESETPHSLIFFLLIEAGPLWSTDCPWGGGRVSQAKKSHWLISFWLVGASERGTINKLKAVVPFLTCQTLAACLCTGVDDAYLILQRLDR